jgi:hypothetical protein
MIVHDAKPLPKDPRWEEVQLPGMEDIDVEEAGREHARVTRKEQGLPPTVTM